jgi:FtsP/CotA-like multicopper oxidase with cupredoxin domain
VLPNDDPSLPANLRIGTHNANYDTTDYSQPNSALIQVNPGERVLLRLANLGYQQHAMQLPGIPMHVIGQDASLLRNGTVDTSYWTNTLYIGPGEARDVLFDAPAYAAARPSGCPATTGNYNVYRFKNRPAETRHFRPPGAGGCKPKCASTRIPCPPRPS